MKTIANVIIINSQNVKLEHLLAVTIISVFKKESSVCTWTSSTEVTNTELLKLNTELLKLLLDELKSLRHWLAELHIIKVLDRI